MTKSEFIQRFVISAASRPEVYQGSEFEKAKKAAQELETIAPFEDELTELKMQIVQLAQEWVGIKKELNELLTKNM